MIEFPVGRAARAVVSTRLGGKSAGPWRWLNLGAGIGDRPETVAANWDTFCRMAGRGRSSLMRIRQVHGDRVVVAGEPGVEPWPEADGLVTRDPRATLVVLVADCAPLFLADEESGVVGLAHAGWRGTLAGIAAAAVRTMEALGARPDRVRAYVGPHIGPCCYEVDERLADRFRDAFGDVTAARDMIRPGRPGHAFLDLARANRAALVRSGVPTDKVEDSGLCTACRTDLFYSHRGEGGRTGRMAAAIWLRGQNG